MYNAQRCTCTCRRQALTTRCTASMFRRAFDACLQPSQLPVPRSTTITLHRRPNTAIIIRSGATCLSCGSDEGYEFVHCLCVITTSYQVAFFSPFIKRDLFSGSRSPLPSLPNVQGIFHVQVTKTSAGLITTLERI